MAAVVAAFRQYESLTAGVRQKDVAPGVQNQLMGHGYNGLFSFPGLEPDIINALALPQSGIIDYLPSLTSNLVNPVYGIMTGVTAGWGDERETPCGTPPEPGNMKLCKRILPMGTQSLSTKTLDIRNEGLQRDRSDFLDFNFINNPLYASGLPAFPQLPFSAGGSDPLRTEGGKMLFEFGVEWIRKFCPLIWNANPTNNNAGGGYSEPYGLDYQINDGYQDISGVACPASDSLVRDFNSLDVADNAYAFVQELSSMLYYLESNAADTKLTPVTHAVVMTRDLFWIVSEVWACAYWTTRCNSNFLTEGQIATIDAQSVIKLRDEMRNGHYLLVNGKQYQVILDECITETALDGGAFTETVYIVLMRYSGNRPGVYLEYRNYDAPGGPVERARQMSNDKIYATNAGRYLWMWHQSNNGCVKGQAETEWRVIVEAPFLCGRLDNVKFVPHIHTRGWDPAGSFYLNGGRYYQDTDSSYIAPRLVRQ